MFDHELTSQCDLFSQGKKRDREKKMQSTSAARDFGTPLALEDVKDFASLGPYPLERCDVAVQCALPRKMPVDKGQPLLPSASSKSPSECALCKSRHNYDLNGYKELE